MNTLNAHFIVTFDRSCLNTTVTSLSYLQVGTVYLHDVIPLKYDVMPRTHQEL